MGSQRSFFPQCPSIIYRRSSKRLTTSGNKFGLETSNPVGHEIKTVASESNNLIERIAELNQSSKSRTRKLKTANELRSAHEVLNSLAIDALDVSTAESRRILVSLAQQFWLREKMS